MKGFLLSMVAVLCASAVLAANFSTDPPVAVPGPAATIADMVSSRSAVQPGPLGAVTPGGYGFSYQILVPVAINASGKNNTFFRSDYFLVNGRGATQEVLIGFLAAGVTNVGQSALRVQLNPNTTYSIADFLGTGTGRLNKTGVGSLLITGVVTGTNTIDTSAKVYGSLRVWTTEPGSTGTNSFTEWAVDPRLIHGDFNGIAVGGRQNSDFRANFGLVNLDATRSRTFTALFFGTSTMSMSVTLPPLSMAEVAVPAITPTDNGYFLANFFPNDTDDFQWNGFVVTADNVTGDAWYSPVTLFPTTVTEY
jgi:hypothetical protein